MTKNECRMKSLHEKNIHPEIGRKLQKTTFNGKDYLETKMRFDIILMLVNRLSYGPENEISETWGLK